MTGNRREIGHKKTSSSKSGHLIKKGQINTKKNSTIKENISFGP
jgi:hypothetical protein